MGSLKSRLALIRKIKATNCTNYTNEEKDTPPPDLPRKGGGARTIFYSPPLAGLERAGAAPKAGGGVNLWPDWTQVDEFCLKRVKICNQKFDIPEKLPPELGIIVDGLPWAESVPRERLLLFDLETTGLSGGAGTVAFLAALGRFDAESKLAVTQYLLLDYPGEPFFLDASCGELNREIAGAKPLIVSYNGRAFDSQLLSSRCFMNGMQPPQLVHADLLYACRRLWRTKIPSCGQADIENYVLHAARHGDLPGSFAPEAWFTFLRTGENERLLAICEHNARDAAGLAAILALLAGLAGSPLVEGARTGADMDALSRLWRRAARLGLADGPTTEALTEAAAREGAPRALRALAVQAEWKEHKYALALEYTEKALENKEMSQTLREDFERRLERLRQR